MKKSIFLILFLILFPFIAKAQDPKWKSQKWDVFDKILFSSLTALHITDSLQTNYIFDHQNEYHEKDLIIKEGVNRIGKGFIPLYFAAFASFEFWFADRLNFKNRKIWLSVCVLNSANFVISNTNIGIGFSFAF